MIPPSHKHPAYSKPRVEVYSTLHLEKKGGDVKYYLPDHLGSVDVVTDASGNVLEKTKYYPFGEVRVGGNSRYQYTSQENDPETGLYYYNARYYNPTLRRFTQADTIIPDPYNPQTLNRYTYVNNNPLKYTDPTGEIIWIPFMIMVGVGLYFETSYLQDAGSDATMIGVVGSGVKGTSVAAIALAVPAGTEWTAASRGAVAFTTGSGAAIGKSLESNEPPTKGDIAAVGAGTVLGMGTSSAALGSSKINPLLYGAIETTEIELSTQLTGAMMDHFSSETCTNIDGSHPSTIYPTGTMSDQGEVPHTLLNLDELDVDEGSHNNDKQ